MDCLHFKEDIHIPVPWGHLAAKVWKSADNGENAVPVLALHGWQDNAGSFDTLAPLLPANIHLICLDFCGHGLSSHYPPGMFLTHCDYIYHVKLVIDYLQWEKVTIIGHSMGGHISLFFASMFPDRVHKLITLDVVKLLSAPPDEFPARMKSVLNDFQNIVSKMEQSPLNSVYLTYKQAREKLVRNYRGSVEEEHADILLVRSLRKKGENEYEYTRDPRTIIRPFIFNNFPTEMLKEIARSITCPFLLIRARNSITPAGSEPTELLQEFIDIYNSASKDFRYFEVDGRHHVHLTNPKIVAPYIFDFLTNETQ